MVDSKPSSRIGFFKALWLLWVVETIDNVAGKDLKLGPPYSAKLLTYDFSINDKSDTKQPLYGWNDLEIVKQQFAGEIEVTHRRMIIRTKNTFLKVVRSTALSPTSTIILLQIEKGVYTLNSPFGRVSIRLKIKSLAIGGHCPIYRPI